MASNKWVLITGAAGGIGQALVNEFESNGYLVIACDIAWESNSQYTKTVYRYKVDLISFVKSSEYRNQFLNDIMLITNGDGISALINNAATQILGLARDITPKEWTQTWDVNLNSAFLMIQILLDSLEHNNGSIVNISSIHASLSKPGFLAYATSKAALSALTRNLALELGKNIRINAIEPAAVETQMLVDGFSETPDKLKQLNELHPIGRIAKPHEVAELALFLCTDKCTFLQGATLSTSGAIHGRLLDPN